jgi:hypothetical protein
MPPDDPKPNPGDPLVRILPRGWVIGLAVSSFVLALMLLLCAIFRPTMFGNPISRSGLALATGLCLGVFLFVLYPQDLTLPVWLQNLNKAVSIAGPVALFLILWWQIAERLPDPLPPAGRLFVPAVNGKSVKISASPVRIQPSAAHSFQFWKVTDNSFLVGVYVAFPRGEDGYKADVSMASARDSVPCEFWRGDGPGSIEMGKILPGP